MNDRPKKIPLPKVDKVYEKCFVCGTDNPGSLHFINRIEEDRGVLEFDPKPFMTGLVTDSRELMHGGFTMMMFDEIMLYSIKHLLDIDAVSLNVSVDFLNPARMEYHYRVETVVRERERRKIWMDAIMKAGDIDVARATGLYYQVMVENFVNTGDNQL
ncbi:MAG: PaaI family thioesterase [Clostridia bacterium]|nr:PaaI family thioesterase [Clostridia bacterium]